MTPTIVYKLGGIHRGPKSSTYSYKGVSNDKTLKELLDAGWSLSLDECLSPKPAPAKKKAPAKKVAAKKAPVKKVESIELD